MKIKLSTYTEGQQLPTHCFFILNKGMNAGKPGDTPWANCFVAQFQTLEDRDHYYWLCYGIWVTGKFKYHLVGSAIPFIRKEELWQLLDLADAAVYGRKDLFLKSVSLLFEAQRSSQQLVIRLSELHRARVEILKHFIHI